MLLSSVQRFTGHAPFKPIKSKWNLNSWTFEHWLRIVKNCRKNLLVMAERNWKNKKKLYIFFSLQILYSKKKIYIYIFLTSNCLHQVDDWNLRSSMPFLYIKHISKGKTVYTTRKYWNSKNPMSFLSQTIYSRRKRVSELKLKFWRHCGHCFISLGEWIGSKNSKYFHRCLFQSSLQSCLFQHHSILLHYVSVPFCLSWQKWLLFWPKYVLSIIDFSDLQVHPTNWQNQTWHQPLIPPDITEENFFSLFCPNSTRCVSSRGNKPLVNFCK